MRLEQYRAVGHARRPMAATRSKAQRRQPSKRRDPYPNMAVCVPKEIREAIERLAKRDHRTAGEMARVLLGRMLIDLKELPKDADF